MEAVHQLFLQWLRARSKFVNNVIVTDIVQLDPDPPGELDMSARPSSHNQGVLFLTALFSKSWLYMIGAFILWVELGLGL